MFALSMYYLERIGVILVRRSCDRRNLAYRQVSLELAYAIAYALVKLHWRYWFWNINSLATTTSGLYIYSSGDFVEGKGLAR